MLGLTLNRLEAHLMPDHPRLREKLAVKAGQGVLWTAESDDPFEPDVVVKFLHLGASSEAEKNELRRFAREIRSQISLRHPGIMPILQYDLNASPPWYSMPQARTSLDEVLKAGSMDTEPAIAILNWIMDAVAFAHSEGILHRDIKPANILQLPPASDNSSGWVIADFGLCRDDNSASTQITSTNAAVGTVEFMAPEQFDDAHVVDGRADIYALGKVLYSCLTGRRPFPSIKLELVPNDFRSIVSRCVEEEPAERYQSIEEFRNDLLLVSGDRSSLVNPLSEGQRLAQLVSENLESSPNAARRLSRLLTNNLDDESLFTQIVPALAPSVIAALQTANRTEFRLIVNGLDKHLSGSFGFSFTDRIADMFEAVFLLATDESLRRIALRRILIVGFEHNRFYVADTFCRIAANTEGPTAAMIANLLRDHPAEKDFIASRGNQGYVPVIRDALWEAPF